MNAIAQTVVQSAFQELDAFALSPTSSPLGEGDTLDNLRIYISIEEC